MKLFIGAKGLIEREDGKVLVVREASSYEEGTELGKWDVVGGRIDSGEPLLEGLRREVAEESGLEEIVVGEILGVTENFITIKRESCHIIRIYYACKIMESEPKVTISADHDSYDWIVLSEHNKWNLMEDLHKLFDRFMQK